MKILIINAGSSSLKYQFMESDGGEVFAKGLCEGKSLDECMHLGKTTATQIIQMFDPY